MNYLNYSADELKSRGGFCTAREICNQPRLWGESYLKLKKEKGTITDFIKEVLTREGLNIILTGAGSSAFIGEALQGYFQKKTGKLTRAIATTEIVSHPENYFLKSQPTLLISFARSGNSPESVAAVKLARTFCPNLYELNITCNPNGELGKMSAHENSYTFVLPEETNDKSLAMTSSFSSMLLAGLLIADYRNIEEMETIIIDLQNLGNELFAEYTSMLQQLAKTEFSRIVFLGAGSLYGIARESHLKVQELTDGNIIAKFDSFLGFRHGPKAVVNNSTLMFYLISNNAYSRLYETDLIKSVKNTDAGERTAAIGNNIGDYKFDFPVQLPDIAESIPEEYLSVCYIIPAQIIGFFKSLELGLPPDSPSKSNSISRVVQGVNIYNIR